MASLANQLERVRKSLKEYREDRDILMRRLQATDTLIEKTLGEYEQLLRQVETKQLKIWTAEQAAKQKSYIDTLPNEVLMAVFRIVCKETNGYDTGDMVSYQPRQSPIDISHVCSRWRAISLEQSELWRSFGARLDEGCKHVNAKRRALFGQYLQRSKDLPMDLWFASTMLNLRPGPTVLHDALSCPQRVRRLAIFFEEGNQHANRMVTRIFKSVWPCLESLEIEVSDEAEEFILPTTTSNPVNRPFPRLTQLRSNADLFRQISQHELSKLTTIQMDRCFRVNFTRYPWSLLQNLVRHSTLLELSIGDDLFDPPELTVRPSVGARNLQYFRCSDANVAKWMWTDISFPKLQLLVLQEIELGTLQFPYSVEEYRAHYRVQPALAPNLDTLVLVSCTPAFGPPYMRFLGFATAPATHVVIIDLREVQTSNLFDRLVSNSHQTYWPNMETLTYKGNFNDNKDAPIDSPIELLGFLESQATKEPCKLRLCLDEAALADRENQDWEDWQSLEGSGRFEDVKWNEDIIQWPSDNFFSNRSQFTFDSWEGF